jgi:hypothetical protein
MTRRVRKLSREGLRQAEPASAHATTIADSRRVPWLLVGQVRRGFPEGPAPAQLPPRRARPRRAAGRAQLHNFTRSGKPFGVLVPLARSSEGVRPMSATRRDTRTESEAALASIYGGVCPSPRRAKPAGSPLPPLGLAASRLALCARVLPDGTLANPSTTSGGQH